MEAKLEARAKLVKELGLEQASKVPESELLKFEPDLAEMEKISVYLDKENKSNRRCGSAVTMHF